MKIIVIGGVNSTAIVLKKLRQHGFTDVHVFGFVPKDSSNVSGWTDLSKPALDAGYSFTPFVRLVDCIDAIKQTEPDWLLAVGLSQIIPNEILSLPKKGSVGFHPTALPIGRGRAPIAWLILEQQNGAATFFQLTDSVDDGAILIQEPFAIAADDDAGEVEKKLLEAEATALDKLLPDLLSGRVQAVEQDHSKATYFGKRSPDDGLIDWCQPANRILRLVQASAPPHPGAYTFHDEVRLTILKAEIAKLHNEKGVTGRILKLANDGEFLVQCGDEHLRVTSWLADKDWRPRVGVRLGYYVELEIFNLRQKLKDMEQRLTDMQAIVDRFSGNA